MPNPQHGKTNRFIGLFDGVTSFADLEDRISDLPTPKERGDAFEVFAEAYLATTRSVQAQQVWPGDAIPIPVMQQLNLPTGDMGVDGVFRTTLGEYCAYQVKFRSRRPALTWTELSTFMGLTDHVGQRVLLTNCDDLPELMNERGNFYCIRGTDLDRLTSGDFAAISQWLRGDLPTFKRKVPLPHQEEALAAIVAALEREDRVTAVMACGTGKTLVALWVAERLGCRQVLVLVPSLALMRQTLHEWLRQTRWDRISYRCVCSDPQVSKGADELIVHQSDLDFPVNTKIEEVAQYLAQPFDGTRVVFSTYQSAKVVADALKQHRPFDLAIFDEAHKTAGRQGAKFGYALHDENLPIKKRVFLTATPRHYDVSRRDKEGDAKVVYSMDVPEIYGPTAHVLSFAKAARLGIICNYKVIISVVTTEMVTDALLSRGEVIVKGDAVKARQVANQIALERAVSQHGIKRIFTFHSKVASAEAFVAEAAEGVRTHLLGFDTYHVNGKIRTADREKILRQFAEADRGLVSNARCLTEGVDVPAVDMVAFMSPKSSKIDIVQATGRAMRKDPANPEKATGFVFVPLFMEMAAGENIEDAIQRAGYGEVWSVLEAMQEQDEVLADIIRKMRENKGRTGGFDDSRFREKVEILCPSIEIDQLRMAIDAQCIERLAGMWDERFGELQKFKEENGHCNVPALWPDNPALGTWVSNQRTAKNRHKLGNERTQRLEAIGFDWDPLHTTWEEKFVQLEEYNAENGHCNVPQGWPDNPTLASWVRSQRIAKKQHKLSDERAKRLEAIGFDWNRLDTLWEEMFLAMKEYEAKYGHCNVPGLWPDNQALGTWVGEQRTAKRRGTVSNQRIQRLEAIGFDWNRLDTLWEEMLLALKEYEAKYGDCNVPALWPDNPTLASWVSAQRLAKKQHKLSDERVKRLEAIGFDWSPSDTVWEEKFLALTKYKAKYGHCNVPALWPDNPKLGNWVSNQRKAKKRHKLSDDQIARLDELAFVWEMGIGRRRKSSDQQR
ncbi:MAG: Helicase associated domain protein [Planctomycetes bacterium]|nr:Helicase associated domain protein [Planctomycetota bacterium]